MAHELSTNEAGQVEAMFAGEKPWHGLGTLVDGLQTPAKALDLAHLNWTVEKRPIQLCGGKRIPDRVATVRSDNGAYLGVVSPSYQPVQNDEQAAFIEALAGTGEAVVECVGALREGRRIFWTCKLPKNLKVTDGDEIERYLILANGHDGSLSFRAFWSPIRVVCQNTLNAALRGVKDGVVFYHFLNVSKRMDEARQILGLADTYYTRLGEQFKALLAVSIGESEFRSYLDEVFPIDTGATKAAVTLNQKVRAQVVQNFHEGRGADVAGKTAWGAYNAVTEYIDHQKTQLKADEQTRKDRRFESILLGSGKDLQQHAFDTALELAG